MTRWKSKGVEIRKRKKGEANEREGRKQEAEAKGEEREINPSEHPREAQKWAGLEMLSNEEKVVEVRTLEASGITTGISFSEFQTVRSASSSVSK